MIELLRKKIVDPRFLEIITKFLKTGVKDPKTGIRTKTTLGIPKGGILSPILCNIVLHQFDEYMERLTDKYHQGKRRAKNREYQKLEYRRRTSSLMSERRRLLMEMRKVGNVDKFDPKFKRMKYIRYADDFVILTIGTKDEAVMIKNNVKEYLNANCGVKLNTEKTIITNLRDNNFKFLGAEIAKLERNITFIRKRTTSRILATGRLQIKAPISSILSKMKDMGYLRQNNQQIFFPRHIGYLTTLSHYDIIAHYNSKIYGTLNFFSFASNLNKLGRII